MTAGVMRMLGASISLFIRAVYRSLFLLPLVFFAQVLWLRSKMDYTAYLEATVGTDAMSASNTPEWVQDAPLWLMARQSFWYDLLAVASEASSLIAVVAAAFAIGLLATVAASSNGLIHSLNSRFQQN